MNSRDEKLYLVIRSPKFQGVIGSVLGLSAGYFGGRVDMVVSFIISVRLALPAVLVAVAVVALIGAALFILVLGMNLLGDGPRDITAPEGRS